MKCFSNLFNSRANTTWVLATQHCWIVFFNNDIFFRPCSASLSLSVSPPKDQHSTKKCLIHHRWFYVKRAGCSGGYTWRGGEQGWPEEGWEGRGKQLKKTRASNFQGKQENLVGRVLFFFLANYIPDLEKQRFLLPHNISVTLSVPTVTINWSQKVNYTKFAKCKGNHPPWGCVLYAFLDIIVCSHVGTCPLSHSVNKNVGKRKTGSILQHHNNSLLHKKYHFCKEKSLI